MTRPVATYAALLGFGMGLTGGATPAGGQTPAEMSPADKVALAICILEVAAELGTELQAIGKGDQLVVTVPAPPPNTGKFDVCVVQPDGSLTNLQGRPWAHRPACIAAKALEKCRQDAKPKAGS